MKKLERCFMFIFLIFAVSVTFGEVSTKVYLRDSNELLVPIDVNTTFKYVDYGQIMLGTQLAIIIDSNVAEELKQTSLYIEDDNRNYGVLSARGPEEEYYPDSIFDAAGKDSFAQVFSIDGIWPEENKEITGFDFVTGGWDVNTGDWFIVDYNTIEIGTCNIAFYNWEHPDYYFINELWFTHVPTRDFDNDGVVDFNDFSIFASYWYDDCNEPNSCQGVNLDGYGLIDFNDLMLFTEYWLEKTK